MWVVIQLTHVSIHMSAKISKFKGNFVDALIGNFVNSANYLHDFVRSTRFMLTMWYNVAALPS